MVLPQATWRIVWGLAVPIVLGTVGAGDATIRMDLTAETQVGTGVALRLTATNNGTEVAGNVEPEVIAVGEEQRGEARARLAPGESHAWALAVPQPREPGSFPLAIRVRYTDPGGNAFSALLVHVDRTPGTPPTSVRLALAPVRVPRHGTTGLVIDNPTARVLGGRVVLVVPVEFTPDPESQPAEVPAGGRAVVPLGVENVHGLVGSSYPAYGLFEYQQDGVRQVALAATTIDVVEAPRRTLPLTIGAATLGTAVALAVMAWHRTRRPRSS